MVLLVNANEFSDNVLFIAGWFVGFMVYAHVIRREEQMQYLNSGYVENAYGSFEVHVKKINGNLEKSVYTFYEHLKQLGGDVKQK